MIGIKIPKVPQDVPVAKARNTPIRNTIAGRKAWKLPAELSTRAATNSFAPRESVIAFRLQAKVKIKIAGTIDLNPSGIESMISVNLMFLRMR